MTAPLIALAVLGLYPAQANAPLEININVKNGETIAGEKKFRVTVVSNDPVSQVEFYVGNDLRDSDKSTPYEFSLDTLAENDGDLKVVFAAYTMTGKSVKKPMSLKVDNGVAKGPEFHVTRGKELLTNSKWDEAIQAGRVALKAKPGYNPARIVLARANLGKGVYDRAQKFAEDAVAAEPNNLEALDLLAGVSLRRAFATFNRSGDSKETMAAIADAMRTAIESRRKSLDHQADTASDANLIEKTDHLIRAGRYSTVISLLSPEFKKDMKRSDVSNRLAYSQLMAGRISEAVSTLTDVKRFGTLDAYGYALLAVVATELGQNQEADDAIREAILSDNENLGVLTAQTYIALKKNRMNVLQRFATDLGKDNSARSDVNYFLSALYGRMGRYTESRPYFEKAVLAEPTNYQMYIEQANQAIAVTYLTNLERNEVTRQLENAKMFFDMALVARPNSFEALTGLSIVSNMQGKTDDAVRYGQAATAAGKSYAGAFQAYSAALTKARKPAEAQAAAVTAAKLDKPNLEGRAQPDAYSAWSYFATGGRTPVISAPR